MNRVRRTLPKYYSRSGCCNASCSRDLRGTYAYGRQLNTAEDVEKEFGIMPFTVIPEGDIEEIDEVEKRSVEKKEGRKSNGIYTEKPCDSPEYAETSVCGRGSTKPSARQCELSWKQSEKDCVFAVACQ